jgi:NADH dehydrogenase
MIFVAGATGLLGMEIVRRLRERGEKVRALVRTTSDANRVSDLEKMGVEIWRGDLKDPASFEGALNGADAVVSTVTVITHAKPGDSFEATDEQGNINLVNEAKRAGARRFVFASFDVDGMPEYPLSDAKRHAEAAIMKSGIDYTIHRPSLFMQIWLSPMLFADPGTSTAKVYGPGDTGIEYVSVGDVAEAMVQSIFDDKMKNRVIAYGGPEPVSQRRALEIFNNAFSKPFSPVDIPASELEKQWMGAEDPWQKTFAGLMLGVARGFGGGAGPASQYFPMKMTTVEDVVKGWATPST